MLRQKPGSTALELYKAIKALAITDTDKKKIASCFPKEDQTIREILAKLHELPVPLVRYVIRERSILKEWSASEQ